MSSLLHPKSILVDTSVWVAYLLGVDPQCPHVTRLFEHCATHNVSMLYAPTTLKDVFYIIPRQARRYAEAACEDVTGVSFAPMAWACVNKITEIAAAAPQSIAECELAWMLRTKHDDFEDNLIIASAETCNADYVVTYDAKLLKRFSPACVTPEQLLDLIAA